MAKIRVYELARQLNLTNKGLLDKMKELNITVSSHMSSLEDDAIAAIRASLTGKKKQAVDASRVRPTVIRKRRKISPEQRADTEIAGTPPAAETVTVSAPEPASGTPQPLDAPSLVDAPSPETGPSAAAPSDTAAAEDARKPVKKRKKKKDQAARIIAPPPEPPAAAPKEAAPSGMETTDPEAASGPDRLPGEESRTAAPPASDIDAVSGAVTAAPDTGTAASPEAAAAEEEPSGSADVSLTQQENDNDKKGRRKRKKKKDKDTPARIIQLPANVPDDIEIPLAAVPEPAIPGGSPAPAANTTERRGGKKRGRRFEGGEARRPRRKGKRQEIVMNDGNEKRGGKRTRKNRPKPQKTQITVPKAIKRRIKIDDTIVLAELAKRMGIKANDMIKKLMMLGVMVTVNQTIDYDTAVLVASEFGYEVERASFEEDVILNVDADLDGKEQLLPRSPVVTIMGHVDHGKTSLLDVIRSTRITEGEAGGITQHIGAYSVFTKGGDITFLDTPGHEAFTSMRARGAIITDIVVLVVAADDGVMPQTVEAINHSRAAGVPIIVAINKMDKAGADPDRVIRELSEHGLVSEEWGGDTIFVKVSAKQATGISELLEMILLQAEVLELQANPARHAAGYVVEAKLDTGRGPVATVLIQNGTLKAGQPVVCGVHHGKIRAMLDDLGLPLDAAGPSCPVEVLGLSGVPNAGDEMVALDDDKSAKQVSEHRLQKRRSMELAKKSRMSLEKLFERMQDGNLKDLNIILKADVHGSIEALRDSLIKLSNNEVSIKIIHAATGTVSESDVSLAAVSDAIIIGFNIRPSAKVESLAAEENVDMRFYNIIYNVIKDVKDAIVGMMESTFVEQVLGKVEVRQVFHVPKIGAVAGCYVTDGEMVRNRLVRLIRDGVIVHEGKMASLRRFKDDVKEVKAGYECGIGIEKYNDIKMGDIIECYYLEEVRPEIE
ncbi:MAG: translation initiation factor IF-2 [Desulfobacterales bacterium]|nr:MAG: translation initiation factor IF-2 [Desulfobacterales bacterium]